MHFIGQLIVENLSVRLLNFFSLVILAIIAGISLAAIFVFAIIAFVPPV